MKRALLTAALIFLSLSSILLAAMSDSKAMNEAKRLFGPMGHIGTDRGPLDTYWTKLVGIRSQHCKEKFKVLGSGLNTWEAAFFQVPADAVKGPFSGAVTLKQSGYDDKAVTSVKFVFDDVITSERVDTPAQFVKVQMIWDTRSLANGVHVVCTVLEDSDGNVSRTPAWAVLIDQTKPSIGTGIDFSDKNGYPLVSGNQ